MTRINRWCLFVMIGIPVIAMLVTIAPVQAQSRDSVIVQRMAPGRTPPTIDGQCRTEEYAANANLRSHIIYRPRYSWSAAPMRVIADQEYVYFCIRNLPLGSGSTTPFVGLTFDVARNGGHVPDSDDILLTVSQTGVTSSARGDSSGSFSPDPSIVGWLAAVAYGDEFTWNVEYKVPLTLIGGGAPNTNIGFHVRHNWLRYVGDDYAWPYNGGWNMPNTWGDLWWLGLPLTSSARLDVARISQGLEYDNASRFSYDLIAGKDSFARAQLYTFGPTREVVFSHCIVQQVSRLTASGSVPITGVEQSSIPEAYPRREVNLAPYGFFNGASTFTCWASGAMVADPGDYHFQIEIQLAGGQRERISLGTRRFLPATDLRMLFVRFMGRPSHPNFVPWDNGLVMALIEATHEMQRRSPVRAGAGIVDRSGVPETAQINGLRYYIHPTVGACMVAAGETDEACDARSRSFSELARRNINAQMSVLDASDGRHRDRLDWGMVLFSSNDSLGGQSCWDGHRVAGGTADALQSGGTATIIAHEIAHCLGREHTESVWTIPVWPGLNAVNLRTRQDMTEPVAMMNPSVANVYHTYFLADEWNFLRRAIQATRESPLATVKAPQSSEAQPLFKLTALVDSSGIVTVTNSGRVDDLPLGLTLDNPQGTYALLFRGAGDIELGRLGFEPTFDDPDAGPSALTGVLLIAPLPAGSTSIAIQHRGQTIYVQSFSANPPTVSDVVANVNSQQISLTWTANDKDPVKGMERQPTYSVILDAGNGAIPLLLASGLAETTYTIPLDLMPATTQGKLIVEASDGYNVTKAASNSFSIPDQLPLVGISEPKSTSSPVANQPLTLIGHAYDPTFGPFGGLALTWRSDRDGNLGSGERIETRLSAGVHTLTLRAAASSGLVAEASVQVIVQQDIDGDALPDNYEAQHNCLDVHAFDSIGDPDSDGLSSLAEPVHGTDPCNLDSDGDGVDDGDEVQFGGDPLSASATPPAGGLFVSAENVNVGRCPGVVERQVDVQVATPATVWTVSTNAPWLQVQGGGAGDGSITIRADCAGLGFAGYEGQVLVGSTDGQRAVINTQLMNVARAKIFLPLYVKR